MTNANPALQGALATVLREIVDGAEERAGWLLNPADPGLLRSLDRLSAGRASAPAPQGGASIAAHVDHLVYGIDLLNRWSRGENPFADADWSASWERTRVDDDQWRALRARLREVCAEWQRSFALRMDAGEEELTTVIASAAHLAYHLGSIRQIDRAAHGPPAND